MMAVDLSGAFVDVDYDFFSTYEIPVLSGRVFTEEFPTDRLRPNDPNGEQPTGSGFVLNRRGVVQVGWSPEKAIGKTLNMFVSVAGMLAPSSAWLKTLH